MEPEQYKAQFQSSFKAVSPIVKDVLSQLFQEKIELSEEITTSPNSGLFITAQNFPQVVIMFKLQSASGASQNLIFLDERLALNAFAWMIAEQPAAELTEEHLDGLKEASEQIFGQVKMNAADVAGSVSLVDHQVGIAENAQDLENLIADTAGVECVLQLRKGEENHTLKMIHWPDTVEQEMTNDNQLREGQMPTEEIEASEMESVSVQPAEFGALPGNGQYADVPRNVDMLLDVDLEVSVELDRKTIMVSDLLKLGKGSIVELEKSAGEPLDIFVNGRKFAEGEVVVIDDKFGIRITQLLSPKDRVKSLGT